MASKEDMAQKIFDFLQPKFPRDVTSVDQLMELPEELLMSAYKDLERELSFHSTVKAVLERIQATTKTEI